MDSLEGQRKVAQKREKIEKNDFEAFPASLRSMFHNWVS